MRSWTSRSARHQRRSGCAASSSFSNSQCSRTSSISATGISGRRQHARPRVAERCALVRGAETGKPARLTPGARRCEMRCNTASARPTPPGSSWPVYRRADLSRYGSTQVPPSVLPGGGSSSTLPTLPPATASPWESSGWPQGSPHAAASASKPPSENAAPECPSGQLSATASLRPVLSAVRSPLPAASVPRPESEDATCSQRQ
mmetsp:Transcript_90937/g.294292  ORF Transcript_90937/g.294292 Transcript_90937/m.294292 type:complete len:204 (-) Transcript_90937:1099-1710(-)